MVARELSIEDAVGLMNPTDTLGLGLVSSTPVGLLKGLSQRRDWESLTVSGGLVLGVFDLFLHPNVHYRSSFYGGGERHYQSKGADIQFIPSFFRHYGLLIQHLAPRVMMTVGAMPDAQGNVSLSLYTARIVPSFSPRDATPIEYLSSSARRTFHAPMRSMVSSITSRSMTSTS